MPCPPTGEIFLGLPKLSQVMSCMVWTLNEHLLIPPFVVVLLLSSELMLSILYIGKCISPRHHSFALVNSSA